MNFDHENVIGLLRNEGASSQRWPIPGHPTERLTMHMETKGDKLIITVDVSDATLKGAPMSASGKSRIVATTSGFAMVGKVKVGLNVIVGR
jgi:hypothetical protein